MGGGGGGHGHGMPHTIPDWKSYKVEGIPDLELLQKRLKPLGLKDPWIRNEVWRYQEAGVGYQSMLRKGLRGTFRGLGYAIVAMALTIAYDKVVNKGKDSHGHH
ncbi:unnamed protein product [Candidula unifasciata]|uniref:NADH dehydrogenase [ubiquinone] 1 beta subcomplex subunit 3 n=1 Tax=Candidula unifasciata TaxID=100452 RepID=A0A8S3Z493_9EUPU|nr:unnamed protein product [Candidula unifasciata]